jgi:hypothetical protein
MLVLGTVCSLFIAGGFIFGFVALFVPKDQQAGTMRKAITGICIDGLLITFALLSLLTRQKVAVSGNNSAAAPRKGWSYISSK